MTCHEVQELILESFERSASNETQRRIDAHLSTCDECARFALVQKTLDDRLTALLLPAPVISQASRMALHMRIREHAAPEHPDALLEIMHFGSFALATSVMAAVLPLNATTVVGIGVTLAVVSYVLLSAVRDSLDDVLGADA